MRRSCSATPRWRCHRRSGSGTAGWHASPVGVTAEIGFTLLLDAVSTVAKTDAVLRRAFGACPGWTPQNRGDRGVTWSEAAHLLWPQTVLGILAFAAFAAAGWTATLWALPLAGGLLAAIPLCVVTADRRVGLWMRDRLIAAIPEELRENGGNRRRHLARRRAPASAASGGGILGLPAVCGRHHTVRRRSRIPVSSGSRCAPRPA